jgi:DNA polymerase-3 subunit beta
MKITINSKQLLQAIQKVGGCIKQNHTIPMYQNVLFMSNKHTLELMATNLEITALTEVPATIKGNVHTCINYQLFSSILKNMPDGALNLEFDDKNVKINQGDSNYQLPLMDSEGFATGSSDGYENSFKINTKRLLSSLKRAEKFITPDELRPFTTAINLHADGTSLMVVATDGHQFYHENLQESPMEFELLIHKATISFLSTNPFSNDEIEIMYQDKSIVLKDATTWVEMLLVNTKYIKYTSIIPKGEGTTVFEVDRDRLLHKLNNLSPIYTGIDYKLLKIELKKDNVTLSCDNDFLNNKGKEVLPVPPKGNELTIGFNADIFKDMISVIEEETVTIHFTEPKRPAWVNQNNILALALPYGLG